MPNQRRDVKDHQEEQGRWQRLAGFMANELEETNHAGRIFRVSDQSEGFGRPSQVNATSSQPAMNESPPSGVIMPSQRNPERLRA